MQPRKLLRFNVSSAGRLVIVQSAALFWSWGIVSVVKDVRFSSVSPFREKSKTPAKALLKRLSRSGLSWQMSVPLISP